MSLVNPDPKPYLATPRAEGNIPVQPVHCVCYAWIRNFSNDILRPSYRGLVIFVVASTDFIGPFEPALWRIRELVWALSWWDRGPWKPEWAQEQKWKNIRYGLRTKGRVMSTVRMMDCVSLSRWARNTVRSSIVQSLQCFPEKSEFCLDART